VKTKNNHGRTKKSRIEVADMNLQDDVKREFLSEHLHYDVGGLRPVLRNNFRRITLVNRAKTERLTIDTQLRFFNNVTEKTLDMGKLVIIELKRDGLCASPVLAIGLDVLRATPCPSPRPPLPFPQRQVLHSARARGHHRVVDTPKPLSVNTFHRTTIRLHCRPAIYPTTISNR